MKLTDRQKLINSINNITCTLDKKHKYKVMKLDGIKFTARCHSCFEKFAVTNEITGTITLKNKNGKKI